jgi:hypothetical protein
MSFLYRNTTKLGLFANHAFNEAKVNSLSQFETQIEKLAFPENPSDLGTFNPFHDVLGEGFETMNHFIRTELALVPEIQMVDSKNTKPGTPGVDAVGKWDGKTKTAQDKYKGRSKAWQTELAEDPDTKLERFLNFSQNQYGVPLNSNNHMIVFTNAKDIIWWTKDKLLFNKVRCFGRAQYMKYCNNKNFFDKLRESLSKQNKKLTF